MGSGSRRDEQADEQFWTVMRQGVGNRAAGVAEIPIATGNIRPSHEIRRGLDDKLGAIHGGCFHGAIGLCLVTRSRAQCDTSGEFRLSHVWGGGVDRATAHRESIPSLVGWGAEEI